MRKVILYMTVTLDGFIAGPNNELDWMTQTPDQEQNEDIVALLRGADAGIMGYPTATGMIPYWSSVAKNPSTSKGEHTIAQAISKLHSIVISNRAEKIEWDNSELLLVNSDDDLMEAVTKIKHQPGKDLGVPGGVRTARTFVRLGLVEEYVLMMHPLALGNGKRLFTNKVSLELVSAKTYKSGVMRLCYRPC
jgi:dihydrofolate reductase